MDNPQNSPDYGTNVSIAGAVILAADGAIPTKVGTVFITKATAAAITLALPTAVTDDGKMIRIMAVGAGAHVVTTPALGVNNAKTTLTFSSSPPVAGSFIELIAYNGSWWSGPFNNVTVS